MKKILVTGAKGFLGKNLVCEIKNIFKENAEILEVDIDTPQSELDRYLEQCDFVAHLAGVNRPKDTDEFVTGNKELTEYIVQKLESCGNLVPVMISSSTQAELDNPYGASKKAAENAVFDYSKKTGMKVFVYRFPNLFGKWCRPNYNSAVSTFCHNIANGLDITVNDPDFLLRLAYIDDVVKSVVSAINGHEIVKSGDFCTVEPVYEIKLGEVAELIYSFKKSRENLFVPDMSHGLAKKLYSTYLSYLPTDEFSYPLKMNVDNRGSFTEFIKTAQNGQVSINISKPHITKGNHWHHTKNEKFLVVSGTGVIRFRKTDSDEILEYFVSGEKLEVVDIPVGYTHNIENTGDNDMVTVMWANESFDPQNPDTYFLEI